MRTRRLGETGPELTTVGFGAWAIGGPWRFGWGEVDDDESIAAIRRAVELGVNWVDTAAVYGLGHSEEVVGRALAPYPRRRGRVRVHEVRPAVGRPPGGRDRERPAPESIREECERSLRRLGLERIDLYQFHWPDWTTGTPLEDSWGTMAELVEEGKARWIGVANFDPEQLERCEAIRHVDSVQPPLSLLARGARRTVLPWAAEHGTGVIVYSPMASGLLTGGFDRERIAASTETTGAAGRPVSRTPRSVATSSSSSGSAAVADRSGRPCRSSPSPGPLAQPGVTAAIVGRASPRHVDGWLGASELELAEERARRDRRRGGGERGGDGRAAAAAAARAARGRPEQRSPHETRPALDGEDQRRLIVAARRGVGQGRRSSPSRAATSGGRGVRAERGIPSAHGSYEALLEDPDVDAVYVSLPNSLHHEWSMRALAAGKHVLCEKPYSRHPADVEEAFDAAARPGSS